MKRFFLILFLALLLAFAFPQFALAMGLVSETAPFTIPDVFQVALLGFATFWIVEGLKKILPSLVGFGPQIAGILVAITLDQLFKLINIFVPPSFWPLVTDFLLIAATWLVANGIKRVEQNFRVAFNRSAMLTSTAYRDLR